MPSAIHPDRIVVYTDMRPCLTCGKPHNAYARSLDKSAGYSWADPDDGHAYHAASWASIGKALWAKYGMPELDTLKAYSNTGDRAEG